MYYLRNIIRFVTTLSPWAFEQQYPHSNLVLSLCLEDNFQQLSHLLVSENRTFLLQGKGWEGGEI